VWVYYLIFVIVSGEGRGSVDACGRLGALLPSLRAFISVLPRLSAAHVFSLLNELLSHVFHLSSNKHHNIMITTNTTPHHRHHHHHHHHHPPVLLLTRITRCVCLNVLSLLLLSFQALLPFVFGNNISFTLCLVTPHVFPKLHTHAHTTLPQVSGLPQRPNN